MGANVMKVFRLFERTPLAGDIFRFLQQRRARAALSRTPGLAARTGLLARISPAEVADADACPRADCEALDRRLEVTRRVAGPEVVNAGDRLALAHLVCRFRPRRILEVGTHAGASTLSMALALAATGEGSIDTVDLVDVNAADERRRAGLDPESSPRQLLQSLDLEDRVRFITSDGLEYLRRTSESYDLVFLDGDHSAVTVYREIPAAINRLTDDGVIVLHDYFPGGRPLWSDGRVEQGPWLAVQRLRAEGVDVAAVPLGATLADEARVQYHEPRPADAVPD
jgi:predicted O-methyltransferase YrrM